MLREPKGHPSAHPADPRVEWSGRGY